MNTIQKQRVLKQLSLGFICSCLAFVDALTILGLPSAYAQPIAPTPYPTPNPSEDFKGYPKPVDTNAPPANSSPKDNTERIQQLERLNEGNKQVKEQLETGDDRHMMAPARIYYDRRIQNTNQQIEELKK
jgi:hypothetical protein